MKKILFVLAIFITGATSAQTISSLSNSTTENAVKASKEALSMKDNPKIESQIKEQLLTNEEFGSMAIKELKSNPSTLKTIANISKKNKGAVSGIMKTVMENPELASKVMDWVATNPKVQKYALGLIDM